MKQSVLWWDTPAQTWINALPLGDGRLGAKVFGGTNLEQVGLNIETLWSGRPRSHGVKNGPEILAAIRSRLLAGDRTGADELEKGMQGPFNDAYQPLGDMFLEFDAEAPVRSYRAELDLATGIASCSFTRDGVDIKRRVFASRHLRALVLTVEASQSVNLKLRLKTPHPILTEQSDDRRLILGGISPATVDREACHSPVAHGETPGLSYGDDGGVGFATCLLVDSHTKSRHEGGALQVQGQYMTFYITAATTFYDWREMPSHDLSKALRTVREEADAAERVDLNEAVNKHIEYHGGLYNRVRLELESPEGADHLPMDERVMRVRAGANDPGLYAAYYNFARYLLISSSAPGSSLPATLQGLWNDKVNPPWFSSYTTNINLQMNYWLAEPAGLSDCVDPLVSFIESLASAGIVTAREVFGFDGWCVNHNVDAWRSTWPAGGGVHRPTWSFSPSCGMWMAMALAERDAFAPDDSYLRQRAFPVFEGAVRFALDWLVRVADEVLITPSTSPENDYRYHDGGVVDFDIQTTFDRWIVGETIETYLGWAKRLGVKNQVTVRATQALEQLRKPRIGQDGRLQEWSEEFPELEIDHRHFSHLVGLYPGNQIDPVRTPDLARAVSRSLAQRREGNRQAFGFTYVWMACLYARLFDARNCEWALRTLVEAALPGSGMNFETMPGVYQIDANLGLGAAVSEMLLQSHRGVIRPLPALPRYWTAGSLSGFRVRGGLTASISWKGGRGSMKLEASHQVSSRVALPKQPEKEILVHLTPGETWTCDFEIAH